MNIYNSITAFLKDLGNYITFDYLAYAGLGLLFLVLLISVIRTGKTYEVRLLKQITKLNKYFAKNPAINDENIVEINNKMKAVPKTLRACWQEYMLNRDKDPSEYINTVSCVDQPSKASAYANTATTCGTFTSIITAIVFLIGMARYVIIAEVETVTFATFLFEVMLLPLLIFSIGYLFVSFLRARRTSIVSDLYYSFHEFERNLDKACVTMPAFIDYEVLFTRKEIKEGIPVLHDYLEKRALEEQREREEAELNANKYEYYNFDELGVENALLLERAMKECEKYINVKRELAAKVQSKETEMYNYQKNFDEVTKDFERKAQAARESLAQLNEQINQTTIKIEANYMKKRYNEEQMKLQQLEKDYELATSRYQKQQDEITSEIDALNGEINRRRLFTEDAMKAECKTYANKIYGQISRTVQEQSKPFLDQINEDKNNLEATISELKNNLENTTSQLDKANAELSQVKSEYDVKVAELAAVKELKDYLTSPEFKRGFLSKKEIRKLDDGTEVLITEDVVRQIADLEKRVQLAEQNVTLYQDKISLLERNIQSNDRELEQARKLNNELFEKAKDAQVREQKAVKELEEEKSKKKVEKPEKAEAPAPAKKEIKLPSTPSKEVPVSEKTVRAPRKKASLDSLLDAVTKMQNDSLSSKTVSSKARTNRIKKTTDEE